MPGPGAYDTRGENDGPKFTIKGRHSSPERPITAPYRSIPTTVGEGPKYSLASRTGTQTVQDTPGPSYVPPPLGHDAKKSSMSPRHSHDIDPYRDNPGPGAYNVQPKFANDAPKSTMHQRTKMIEPGTASPGPGAYMPNYNATRKGAQASTMHIRPQTGAQEVTPGPSDYEVKRSLGGTSPTLHMRVSYSNAHATPGPGAYSPENYRNKGPSFTMKGRHDSPQRTDSAPYRSLPSTVGQGPKISLSSRHTQRGIGDSPGPNYVPPPLGSDARKMSMSYRHLNDRDPYRDNPGPGAYNVQPKFANDAPKATMHQRTRLNEPGSASPGPGAYKPDYNATKRRAPAASMHVRTKLPGPEQTPGYYYKGSTLGGPRFTIGRREELDLCPI